MSTEDVNTGRRRFLIGATSAVGAVGAVGVAVPFVKSWNPSAKAKTAGAPVQFDLSKLEPGQMATVEWRGKPVFVLQRTKEAMATLTDPLIVDQLRDPNSDQSNQPPYTKNNTRSRAQKPEVVVLIGLCTHLGCVPLYRPDVKPADLGEDWLGGYYCPCHGSKYDMAGRIYSGMPAPTNMDIPPYFFESENILAIGLSGESIS